MRPIVPVAQLTRRIPEAGRIRFGVKTAKAMKAIDRFRFTSHDEEALAQVAALYGGTVQPWSEPKAAPGQFEVITEASEIKIVLPPDPLGGTPIYEKWSGGGCERRCDGLTCSTLTEGPDGLESTEIDCVCMRKGAMECEVHTRLSVMLAGVRFGGTWRLDTKSWNAAQELPGMVELIQSMQERGLTRGVLALKQRRTVTAGKTKQFIVPVLGVEDSLEAIAAGNAQLGALPSTEPVAALGAGEPEPAEVPVMVTPTDDDEPVDAEIVDEDDDGGSEGWTVDALEAAAHNGPRKAKALRAARDAAARFDLAPPEGFEDITSARLIGAALEAIR